MDDEFTLPHSTESERAVLGGVLLDPDQLNALQGVLTPEDFYIERHGLLWQAMLSLAGANQPIDMRTLQAWAESAGKLGQMGGLAYLATLDLDLPDVERLPAYADIVRDRSVRRRAIQRASQGIRDLTSGGGPEALGRLTADLEALAAAPAGRGGGFRAGGDVLGALLERIENIDHGRPPEGPKTGIPELDALYGAIEPGTVAIIGGRSGVGKSVMLAQMVARDLEEGRPVAVESLELGAEQLLCRIIGHRTGLNWRRVWRGQLSGQQWREVYAEGRRIQASGLLHIDDTKGQSLEVILARLKGLVKTTAVRTVYLDFFTMLPRPGRRAAHEERDEQAYRIASFAADPLSRGREEDRVSFVLLAQLTRGPAKENRVPIVADLRDAGEQAATYVFLVHRDIHQSSDSEQAPVYGPEGLVVLGKARNDDEGAVWSRFDGARQRWWGRAQWEQAHGGAHHHEAEQYQPPIQDDPQEALWQ